MQRRQSKRPISRSVRRLLLSLLIPAPQPSECAAAAAAAGAAAAADAAQRAPAAAAAARGETNAALTQVIHGQAAAVSRNALDQGGFLQRDAH
jgi:hypothetical protein